MSSIPPKRFELTADHLTVMSGLNISWQGDDVWGVPTVDEKRPYGSSSFAVDRHIHDLLDGDPHVFDAQGNLPADLSARYFKLHREMETALQIAVRYGPIAGTYEAPGYSQAWVLQP